MSDLDLGLEDEEAKKAAEVEKSNLAKASRPTPTNVDFEQSPLETAKNMGLESFSKLALKTSQNGTDTPPDKKESEETGAKSGGGRRRRRKKKMHPQGVHSRVVIVRGQLTQKIQQLESKVMPKANSSRGRIKKK